MYIGTVQQLRRLDDELLIPVRNCNVFNSSSTFDCTQYLPSWVEDIKFCTSDTVAHVETRQARASHGFVIVIGWLVGHSCRSAMYKGANQVLALCNTAWNLRHSHAVWAYGHQLTVIIHPSRNKQSQSRGCPTILEAILGLLDKSVMLDSVRCYAYIQNSEQYDITRISGITDVLDE